MEFETLQLSTADHVAMLTLNRADKRNAINRKMMEELTLAIPEIARNDDIRVMVLTGSGKTFCAGADVDLMPGGGEVEDLGEKSIEGLRRSFIFRAAKEIILGIHRMEKPTIAMVNGACVGAGLDLALACDLRTASEQAKFMCGFVKIGLFPGFGAAWLYPRTMGLPRALEMLYTGDVMDAKGARDIGMINALTSAENLEQVTISLAQKIAGGPPIAIRLMKRQAYKGLGTDLETALDEAATCEAITLASRDHKEGIEAFREKRTPIFKGD